MSLLAILLTSIGLAMDAVAVSVSSGMSSRPRRRDALKMAVWFGGFQALMPAAGFLLGVSFRDWVAAVDHWIAFLLLVFIGGKMVREAFARDDAEADPGDPFETKRMTLLAIATSIDALAVGVTFSLLEISLVQTVGIIGLTTAVLCYPAVLLGRRLGRIFSRRAELAGGIVLIAIGTKILLEHTVL